LQGITKLDQGFIKTPNEL